MALYIYKDKFFLVFELHKQGSFFDIMNCAPSVEIMQQGACLDELLVMFFAIELMHTLEELHRTGFIYGDVKIDNCLLWLEDVPRVAAGWVAQYGVAGRC